MSRISASVPTFLRTTLGLAVWITLAAVPVAAQPTAPVDTFDLVLYGEGLNAPGHTISLKTNPWRSDRWIRIAPSESACAPVPQVRVVPALSAARFLGQDIRENYIALKIRTTSGTEGTLRAAYALPATPPLGTEDCQKLAQLIASSPAVVRRHSVAHYVRPRPASLSPQDPFIDHLEAPIRHRKPGEMEVEWLQILIGPDE